MPRRGFHSVTLGCKLNRFDTAAIEGELTRRGLEPCDAPDDAEVVVVNTCTVTHRADADARKAIRAIRRRNPGCRLLVTGCYAESDAEAIASLGGVDRVFGNRDKPRVGAILDELGIGESPAGDRGCDGATALPDGLHFGERSRAFLKIQEGCRLACSYCIIPTVRGPSRSVPAARVVGAARALIADGFREIVLTGVNTGDWGRDLDPADTLAGLLRRLLADVGPTRIRLNSLEPLTVTDEIVALFAADPRLAPHLQVPLQSGSPAVLRAMRRNYRLRDYDERVRRLARLVPDVALGADVIVGFPGETEARFRETLGFIEASPLAYLHVFSWSPREGTPAATLPDRVDPGEIAERSRRLRALGERLGSRFRDRFVGRRLDAVVLERARPAGWRALTGNFIDLRVDGPAAGRFAPRDLIDVEVRRVTPAATFAVAVGRPAWTAAAGA